MSKVGVALDLGTSGFRGQAIDLERGGVVISTVITARHPLPGANVMDHLHLVLEVGLEPVRAMVIATVNQLIAGLQVTTTDIVRLVVCGNPIQLSLFEGIEVRDLAYAGKNKKRMLGIVAPDRDGKVVQAKEISGLLLPPQADVFILPAVKHEIGADALAMLVKSGILERREIALVTDYGTNAEMALKVGDTILTGSCAAGPALEGQHISAGMLAAPGAVADIYPEGSGHRLSVLDTDLYNRQGNLVDLPSGNLLTGGEVQAQGITGTGVVALICEAQRAGLLCLPRLITPDCSLHLGGDLIFTEKDLAEAGKAIGALRAGYVTLAKEAGIQIEDIQVAYMAGASGTYVDPLKAMEIGMVPPQVKTIVQIGNTSLSMARDVVCNPALLGEMQAIAKSLRATHCMFGESPVFEKAYILELAYWEEGMPWTQYMKFSELYRLPKLNPPQSSPKIIRQQRRDIDDLGSLGLKQLGEVGLTISEVFSGCSGCGICVEGCPERALTLNEAGSLSLRLAQCNGTACKRCEQNCPEKVFKLSNLCQKVTIGKCC